MVFVMTNQFEKDIMVVIEGLRFRTNNLNYSQTYAYEVEAVERLEKYLGVNDD